MEPCHGATVSLYKPAAQKAKNAFPLAICNSHLFFIFKRVLRETKLLPAAVRRHQTNSVCEKCNQDRSNGDIGSNSHHTIHEFIRKVELLNDWEERASHYCLCQIQTLLQLVLSQGPRVELLEFKDHHTIQVPASTYLKSFFTSGSLKGISTISIRQPFIDTLKEIHLLHNLKVVLLSDVRASLQRAVENIIVQSKYDLREVCVRYEDVHEIGLRANWFQTEVDFQILSIGACNSEHSMRSSIFRNALKRCNDPNVVCGFHLILNEPRPEVR